MHRKEQEILAILGLILSVSLLIWTIYYLRLSFGREYELITPPEDTKSEIRLEWTEKDNQVKGEALEFGSKVIEALFTRLNYDYIYNVFDEQQKEIEFGYDIKDARRKLESYFGRFGLPENIRFTAQIYNSNRPVNDWKKTVFIENIYRITYNNDYGFRERRLTLIIKVENERFFINGIKFE